MIKSYILYDSENNVTQFTRCDETEIELYQSEYIEYSEDSFEFDSNYTYKIESNKVVKTERNDKSYLLSKVNADFETAISSLTSSVPTSEIATWPDQKAEAKAWTLDNSAATPLIDSICLTRECDKEYLVSKILAKNEYYSIEVGKLTGIRQKLEKEILGE